MDVKALCREDAEPYGETQRVPAYRQEAYGRCSLCFTGGMGTFHAATALEQGGRLSPSQAIRTYGYVDCSCSCRIVALSS